MLLYSVAIMSVLIGCAAGYYTGSLAWISTGLLTATLFGVMAKICHLLELIEEHLCQLKDAPTSRQRIFVPIVQKSRHAPVPLFGPRSRIEVETGVHIENDVADRRAVQ